MNDRAKKHIEQLECQIENAKKHSPLLDVLDEYIRGHSEEIISVMLCGKISIKINVDDKFDFESLCSLFIGEGEKFDPPYLYDNDDDKCLITSSKNVMISGYLTGKKCKLVKKGVKEVPVYGLECMDSEG